MIEMESQAQKTQHDAINILLQCNDSHLELSFFGLNSKQIADTVQEFQDPKPIDLKPNVVEVKLDIPQYVHELPVGVLRVVPENDVLVPTESGKVTACTEMINKGNDDVTRDLRQEPSNGSTEEMSTVHSEEALRIESTSKKNICIIRHEQYSISLDKNVERTTKDFLRKEISRNCSDFERDEVRNKYSENLGAMDGKDAKCEETKLETYNKEERDIEIRICLTDERNNTTLKSNCTIILCVKWPTLYNIISELTKKTSLTCGPTVSPAFLILQCTCLKITFSPVKFVCV